MTSSWVPSQPGFSLQNLPYGVFSTREDSSRRIGTAAGCFVLDLRILARGKVFEPLGFDTNTLQKETLNEFAGLDTLSGHLLRDHPKLRGEALVPLADVRMHLPMTIGDYTDFYTSPYHASNCNQIVRPGTELPAAFWRMPLGYHGRSSSIIPSGSAVRRPRGQFLVDGVPTFGPCRKLDFEVELGVFVGKGSAVGESIDVNEAHMHIFGFVLLNDWSARDIQRAETGLMGPLNGKNFATSISPWIVSPEALEPYRTTSLLKDSPLPYLDQEMKESVYDIPIDAFLQVGLEEYHLGQCNVKNTLFSVSQLLAHHTVGGCPMRPGDLLATGTLSGPSKTDLACLLEITRDGASPFEANSAGGSISRAWLEDGDGVRLNVGKCSNGEPFPISFGTCEGRILPSQWKS